ncbi:hypothetical protein M2323_001607 [Rhodoblastus acidophilus]|nr:hypothetical protein [Rhodoblastus acidophilus]MCW2283994.1 hypothetical protein [Rhodoblastus acidophilus]MCW2332690.1 hypothetical protein [Rhodoblastus acidophilus]
MDELSTLDVEYVGEVAAQRQFKIEAGPAGAMIGDAQVFMQAAVEMAPKSDRDCAFAQSA